MNLVLIHVINWSEIYVVYIFLFNSLCLKPNLDKFEGFTASIITRPDPGWKITKPALQKPDTETRFSKTVSGCETLVIK